MDRWIAISESKGGRADHHLREYGQTGGSPIEIFQEEGQIAISESTGGTPAHSKRADRWIAISEITGRRADWWIAISESTGGGADRHRRE